MLKTRVIPILLWDGVQAVKTKQFKRPARPVGSMMQHILTMQERDVDELIILDINATREGREPFYNKIELLARQLYCPLTYGGGIYNLDQIKALLNSGVDKVAIKTAFLEDPDFIDKAVQKFGAQCITIVIDYFKDGTGLFPLDFECGEILLTSVMHEGMMNGYDIPLITGFSSLFSVPIIANGGAATPQHMLEAIKAGASAVAAGSMFLYTDTTPKDCAKYLTSRGVECRIS